jgi:hypothetical protein
VRALSQDCRWTRRKIEGPWYIMQDSAVLYASHLPWLQKRDVAIIGTDLSLDVMPSGIEKFSNCRGTAS